MVYDNPSNFVWPNPKETAKEVEKVDEDAELKKPVNIASLTLSIKKIDD